MLKCVIKKIGSQTIIEMPSDSPWTFDVSSKSKFKFEQLCQSATSPDNQNWDMTLTENKIEVRGILDSREFTPFLWNCLLVDFVVEREDRIYLKNVPWVNSGEGYTKEQLLEIIEVSDDSEEGLDDLFDDLGVAPRLLKLLLEK